MIYTIGEIVLDIICKDFDHLLAKPGGSMLNSAITLGRLKQSIEHISYVSTDKNGQLIIDFLLKNGVGANYLYQSASIKTNLAFAHLDMDNNAHYTFYKDDLTDYRNLKLPVLTNGDVILFGSFFSLNPKIREVLVPFLEKAKKSGALLIYDPNFREAHKPMLPILKQHIEKNMQLAHVVKGSNEDFHQVFGIKDAKQSWDLVKGLGVNALVYTKGKNGAELHSHQEYFSIDAKSVETLSTIGAGDTFSAGLIYGLVKNNQVAKILKREPLNWLPVLEIATHFAAEVCASYDNYLSTEYIASNHV